MADFLHFQNSKAQDFLEWLFNDLSIVFYVAYREWKCFAQICCKSPMKSDLIACAQWLSNPTNTFIRRLPLNRPVPQMQASLAACHEPAESYDKATRNAICFWTQNEISFNPCSIFTHCGILMYRLYPAPPPPPPPTHPHPPPPPHPTQPPPHPPNRFLRYNTPCFVKQRYLWNIDLRPSVSCYNV